MTWGPVTGWRRCPTCDVAGWELRACWCCGGPVEPWWAVGQLPPWPGMTVDELLGTES